MRHRSPAGILDCHDSPRQLFQTRCTLAAGSRARTLWPAPPSAGDPREGARAWQARGDRRRVALRDGRGARGRRGGLGAAGAQGQQHEEQRRQCQQKQRRRLAAEPHGAARPLCASRRAGSRGGGASAAARSGRLLRPPARPSLVAARGGRRHGGGGGGFGRGGVGEEREERS